jgi:uncharacterized YceG family protein
VFSRKDPSQERTAEERARAAAERAARRGEAPPPVPRATPEPRAPAPEPPAPTVVAEPEPEPEPLPPPRRAAPLPAAETVRRARARAARTRPAAAPPPARHGAPRGRARLRILALLALVAIGLALWAINATFQPFHGDGEGAVAVTIPPGADAKQIGDILAQKGVVDSGTFFNVNATLTLRRGKLRPGDYTLPRGMSYGGAIEALMQGPKAKVVKTISVTIPEGRTRREMGPIAKKAGLEGDYAKASRSRKALRRAHALGLPKASDNMEGFLFPATYELVAGAPASHLVDKQLSAMDDALGQVNLKAAKRRNLTRYDVVVIASMVEREAMLDKERPLIAAVIHNRLREGIPLGIDATIRYDLDNWTRPLRVSELERDTPYNTRINRGLPPTPIGNPGLASLKAAAAPANVDYLFYVVKPGTCGEHAFSSTDAQFQEDVARYNAEREKAGGKSPTKC